MGQVGHLVAEVEKTILDDWSKTYWLQKRPSHSRSIALVFGAVERN